jgi:hypothetical protein
MRNSIQACEELWQAVLERALMDMSLRSKKPEKVKAKAEAQTWHIEHQNELEIICDHAGASFVEELKRFKKEQAKADYQPIIFAQTIPAKPEQISFLPQLLHGFQPTQFCVIKRKKQRIQSVTICYQLELWN